MSYPDPNHRRPTGDDAPTELIRPANTTNPGQYPAQRPEYRSTPGYQDSPSYREPSRPQPGPSGEQLPEQQPRLIRGRFDQNKVIMNLAVLAVIAGIITFAVVLVADKVVAAVGGVGELGVPFAVIYGFVTAGVVAGVGALYIPVIGTGNEGLFTGAVVVLTLALVALWGVFAGLLDGQWEVIVTMVAIACVGMFAYAAPGRVDAAEVTTGTYRR